jgi:hypothetical protein
MQNIFYSAKPIIIVVVQIIFEFLVFFYFELKKYIGVDCEYTTDYTSRISCINLTSHFTLFVILICRPFNANFEEKFK